jgi:hypothetical protein
MPGKAESLADYLRVPQTKRLADIQQMEKERGRMMGAALTNYNPSVRERVAGAIADMIGGDDARAAYRAGAKATDVLDVTPAGAAFAANDAGRAVGSGLNALGAGNELGGAANIAGGVGMAVLGISPATRKLPLDEASRMARADAQGYTVNAFKGAYPYDWNTVPTRNVHGKIISDPGVEPSQLTHFDSPSSPYAGFFSNDPAVASRFGELFDEGAVYPVKLKFDNPLVIDARGKPAAAFQFPSIAREHNTNDLLDAFNSAFANGSKYDGVIIKNTRDEGTVYVPTKPQQIRSRFAAFDPSKIGSKDMLAGLAAAPITYGALSQDKGK